MNASRREFFRSAAGLSAAAARHGFSAPLALGLSSLAALAGQTAQAANTSGYKALVCLYLQGGSDSHNWLVPIDTGGQAEYLAARRALAWPTDRLLPIASSTQEAGRKFAMPGDLLPMQQWYQAGKLAWLANVGPMDRPVTKADYLAGRGLPSQLFSHNDQTSAWQSLGPEGMAAGWGGRIGDLLMADNAHPVFTSVSASGNAVFLSGSSVTQYQLGASGTVAVEALNTPRQFGSASLASVLQQVMVDPGSTALQSEYARVTQRSLAAEALLRNALAAVTVPALSTTLLKPSVGPAFRPANEALAQQLRMVARMIAAGQSLGMRRQVFMVAMPGFDTHNYQMRDQPGQMARVSTSVDYFLRALDSLALLDKVVLFSASDFGRTLTCNGDGSDHGWGSHHFVAGGGVLGGEIRGRMPLTRLGTPDDLGSGRLLPGTSVVSLAAELGRWMGLTNSELLGILPTLGHFGVAPLGLV